MSGAFIAIGRGLLSKALTAVLCAAGCCASVRADEPLRPYALEGTEIRSIRAAGLKRDYELYISLPVSYAQSQRSYPVVFTTDAPYAFPLIRSIGRRVNGHGGNLGEFILVGLSYAKGDDPVRSRNRDYTPTDIGAKKTREPDQGDGLYGQAEPYRRFVASEVFPFVARTYRADMTQKIFVGHSYGGLFGIHALLTEPTMFDCYVLGSPSLWFDRRHMFDVERDYAATRKDMPAKVFMLVGALEGGQPGTGSPRVNPRKDMVKDMQAFEKQLKSHRYAGLSIRSQVLVDEDHLTAFPAVATRGLMWAVPAR